MTVRLAVAVGVLLTPGRHESRTTLTIAYPKTGQRAEIKGNFQYKDDEWIETVDAFVVKVANDPNSQVMADFHRANWGDLRLFAVHKGRLIEAFSYSYRKTSFRWITEEGRLSKFEIDDYYVPTPEWVDKLEAKSGNRYFRRQSYRYSTKQGKWLCANSQWRAYDPDKLRLHYNLERENCKFLDSGKTTPKISFKN